MRDYSKVSPKFWMGATGKKLRKAGMEAQIVGMYLLTSSQSNMLGLYYCPLMFIAHETGLGMEGASKGLQSSIEAGFCQYDEASEVVWVMEMASYQIAEELKPNDLRVKGVQNEYGALPENPFLSAFFDKYSAAFHMEKRRGKTSPYEAPSKPLRSQEQEQEQEQEQDKDPCRAAPDETPRPPEPAKPKLKPAPRDDTPERVIDYLNQKTGKKFQPVDANLKFIRARISEGATWETLSGVVDLKCADWLNDPKMHEYLRPATLFNAEKFNQYVGLIGAPRPKTKDELLDEAFGITPGDGGEQETDGDVFDGVWREVIGGRG